MLELIKKKRQIKYLTQNHFHVSKNKRNFKIFKRALQKIP